MASVLLVAPPVLHADEVSAAGSGWRDWFRNDVQRAAAQLAADNVEAVIEAAPDTHWEAIGRYRQGDHAGAVDAYGRAFEQSQHDELQFGQATAATRAGQLDEALALFDQLLSRDPDNEDALHNREIARQLKALEQQQGGGQDSGQSGEQGGESGEGEQGESGEQDESAEQESGEEGSPSEDGAADEQDGEEGGESGERSAGNASSDQSEQAESEQDGGSGQAEPTEGNEAEQAAAQAALAAESESEPQSDDDDSTVAATRDDSEPPTEQEQATEQWLRRIADDPTGLLRRRIEQSHLNDYPEVRDSDQPW